MQNATGSVLRDHGGATTVMRRAARPVRRVFVLPLAFCMLLDAAHPHARQQLVDRVLARVGATPVTLTDVQAAVGLGLVEVPGGDSESPAALQATIDRELVLAEVLRFPPPEPSAPAIADTVTQMKAHAGPRLNALMTSAGLSQARLEELARQTLRIRTYISQRFGTAQVTQDEVRKYYEDHPGSFVRNGSPAPFEEVEAQARQQASAERLQATIDQWVRDLRVRTDITIVGKP
jgi:hypothetical protein